MKINELPAGSKITISIFQKGKRAETATITSQSNLSAKVELISLMTRYKSNAIAVNLMTHKGKILKFPIQNIRYEVSAFIDEKVYVWKSVLIKSHRFANKTIEHIIYSDENIDASNRRHFFRVFIGDPGQAKLMGSTDTKQITIKDISISGVCFLSNNKDHYNIGDKIFLQYTDTQSGDVIQLLALIVWSNESQINILNTTGKNIYGCRILTKNIDMQKYINEKQRQKIKK